MFVRALFLAALLSAWSLVTVIHAFQNSICHLSRQRLPSVSLLLASPPAQTEDASEAHDGFTDNQFNVQKAHWSRRSFIAVGGGVLVSTAPSASPTNAAALGPQASSTTSYAPATSSATSPLESFLETAYVPFSSTRQYRAIRLANGLEVLLVRDRVIRQATAALTIGGAGQFSDPPGLSGMAHLMEHMALSSRLSRRQQKRNKVQDFEEWLSDLDGSSNGFTAYEKVCFHFNCPVEVLPQALERFSRLFQQEVIQAICQDTATLQREIRRVDSEILPNDGFLKELYLTKSLLSPEHPYARFSAGNLDSLERLPAQQGISVGDKLYEFFQEHYRPDKACLVVVSPNELSAMEAWVAGFSTALSKTYSPTIPSPRYFPPFQARDNSRLATYCIYRKQTGNGPGEDLEKLSFQWGLNLDYSDLRRGRSTIVTATQIGFILAQILGRRGPGSLYTLLSTRNWVPSGTQGLPKISFPTDVSGFQILKLELTLTRQGFSSRSSVIAAVYDSINALKGTDGSFLLSREVLVEYAATARLYGYLLTPRPPDAIELAFDAQLYGVRGPVGVSNPRWRVFPLPEDRAGIAAIQKELASVLMRLSNPSNAIIVSTASKKSIEFATPNVFENTFPPLSPASWNISPITGSRYTFDKMLRLTGKVNEWLVARLMEDELSPPVVNPLVPAMLRPPRVPASTNDTLPITTNSVSQFAEGGFWRLQRRGFGVVDENVQAAESETKRLNAVDDAAKMPIVRDYWDILKVTSHEATEPTLQLPRIPPEPSSRCVFVLQLLSSRPARANVKMAARAELWRISLEYAMTDLAELGAPAGLAYSMSFNKFGMRICFVGLSQNIASYARRFCRRFVEHQTRLLEGPESLSPLVVETALRKANGGINMSALRRRRIVSLLQEASAVDVAVEGIAFLKSCSGGVCFTQGDLTPREAVALLGDLKTILRKATGSNVKPTPAIPEVGDLIYRANWIPRSASSCTIPGANLVSNPCGRVPR